MITRIRVPAAWRDHQNDGHQAIADFVLGIGSCGKEVVSLTCEIAEGAMMITQHCSDNECKRFIYPIHTLTGRVEITET